MAVRPLSITQTRCLLRGARATPNKQQPRLRRQPPCTRPNSTTRSRPAPPPPPPPEPDRISRILSRLPRPLQSYASRLRGAPVTHVTAFLVLHELTAVVPLLALFGVFHYYADVGPLEAWMRAHYGAYVSQGTERFERYFRRKGWFGFDATPPEEDGVGVGAAGGKLEGRGEKGGGGGLDEAAAAARMRYKVVVEIALAYAITKVLLPLRIVGSVWATPWFAGVLVWLGRIIRPARR